jgi:rhodanese-related sulfurtransferase
MALYSEPGMSYEVSEVVLPEVLEQARAAAAEQHLSYAGGVVPAAAWKLVQAGQAVLVDVRTAEERKFVGYVEASVHVPWATGTSLTRNPRFARELEAKVAKDGGKEAVLLLLCRSGKRSVLAAEVAEKAGFAHVFNVLEGFEGELDENQHRGGQDGWRFHGLPWVQD